MNYGKNYGTMEKTMVQYRELWNYEKVKVKDQ